MRTRKKLYQPEIPKNTYKPEPLIRVECGKGKRRKSREYKKEKKICIDMFKKGYSNSDIVAVINLPHSYVDRWIKAQEKKDFAAFCKKMDIEKPSILKEQA
jgi:hypothetical protein